MMTSYLSSEYAWYDDEPHFRSEKRGPSFYNDDGQQKRSDSVEDLWGVKRHSSYSFPFPLTISTLADQIVSSARAAMSGHGYPTTTESQVAAQIDKNVRNAINGDRALERRSFLQPMWDAGRIGIEIDGPVNIRYVALMVAIKASSSPQQQQNGNRNVDIPVALYLNSVREILEARQMLQHLQQQEGTNKAILSNVEIFSLAHGRLPTTMIGQTNMAWRERKRQRSTGKVDPSKGILFVLEPTGSSVMDLQRLTAQAILEGLPIVLFSPRLTREFTTPWDQHADPYTLPGHSSDEYPPTPWLMRDFWPPVYSWILTHDDLGYTHSILHQKQSWDIFDCSNTRRHCGKNVECDYLASTVNCAGRPPKAVVRKIAKDYQLI